jgi:hypothetical protein
LKALNYLVITNHWLVFNEKIGRIIIIDSLNWDKNLRELNEKLSWIQPIKRFNERKFSEKS